MNRIYGPDHEKFLRDNINGKTLKEMAELFNQHFNLNLKESTITSLIYRLGLKNNRETKFIKGWEPTQFKKGHTPFNKGKKKFWKGGEETQFKKGHKPVNYRPVGSERVSVDGYIEIKVADPNKWRLKHKVVWEEHNGPLQKGYCIIFGDGDKSNLAIDNLICVTRKQLVVLNHLKLIQKDAELTKIGITIVDVSSKISDRRKQRRSVG